MEAVNVNNNANRTPLHYAVINDHLNVVQYLVKQGANMEAVDNANWTPLHIAVFRGHVDAVKYLVDQGANKKAVDKDNRTPLHIAVGKGHLNIAQYLTSQGCWELYETEDLSKYYLYTHKIHQNIWIIEKK